MTSVLRLFDPAKTHGVALNRGPAFGGAVALLVDCLRHMNLLSVAYAGNNFVNHKSVLRAIR
jgi:hypothetical protein